MNIRGINLKWFKGKRWYHQRFDGTPMFIGAIAETEVRREKRKPKGTEANVRVSFFSEGKCDWYLDMADIRQGANSLIELAKKNRNVSGDLLKAWKRDEKNFDDFYRKIFPKIKLRRLSDSELLQTWKRYWSLGILRLSSSSVIDHFALGTDEIISKMLRKEIKRKTTGILKQSEFTDIFSVATAPVHLSFINHAEIDLLKIILKKSDLKLSDYQKKYFWIANNYSVSKVLSTNHFKQEIQIWKKSSKDLAKELKRVIQTPYVNKLKKQKLLKKYKLSKLLKTLLKISEDFTWWQDERKKATYFNTHIGNEFLVEIARRRNYRPEDLKYAVAAEIPTIMKKRNPRQKELEKRRAGSAFIATRKGIDFVGSKKNIEILRRLILGKSNYDEIQDIRGLSASLGRAVGRVKIVKSATEIAKVEKGDILVAVMTRPDYVPAMKRAAAIVTNEGGITSHAAIVSRELGVPCIIGTKIATEVFKEGDLVEVNANHGWVRKITKGK